MSKATHTSIILVNYNTKELTINCIKSIYACIKKYSFEIILVDNNSYDGSVDAITKIFPEVRIIKNNKNLGFGSANNIGVRMAKGDFLFLLNTDTVISCDAISKLYDFYIKNRHLEIGVLGGRILNTDLSFGWSSGRFNTISSVIFNFYKKKFIRNKNDNICTKEYLEVDYVTGADMYLPKKVFESVGGFDEKIFMYYEDEDMQRRLNINGFHNYIVESVRITHNEGSSMPKDNGLVRNSKRIIMERSMFYYFQKWHGETYKKIGKFIYFLVIALPLRIKYNKNDNFEYLKQYIKF